MELKEVLNYLHFILFLKGNISLFYALFTIYFIFLIVMIIIFIVMSLRLKKGKYNLLWPISILKYCLPLISSTFFGQTFLLLLSAFICVNGKTYYDENVYCGQSLFYFFSIPASVLAILIQIMLSYITISMHYQPDFIYEGNDLLKKRSSKPDIIFLFCKIIINIIFLFDKESMSEHWPILFILCLITGFNAYCIFFLQNYENKIIKKFNNFYSLLLFWGFLCLFITNIFKSWDFSGGLYLFIFGLFLIVIYCVFYSKTYLEFLDINFNDINSSHEYINYIRSYLRIIKEKDISRESFMILTSFIEKLEEGCTNKNCILHKYLDSLSKGFDSTFLLLLYAQKLYKIALNRFPGDITLRIHYIIFLLTKINQKKNAQKELLSINSNFIIFDDRFNLYRCKKYIEEYSTIINKEKEEGFENNDIFQALEYKNNVKEFKKLLSKSSSLYYDFWSSLYSSHLQGTEDLKKLNDLGAELNKIIENIEKIFEKLREIKNNDLEIIKLYESYAKNILNDKDKYEKYYNEALNLIIDNKCESRDIDYTNFDLKTFSESDEFKTLIISANNENRGTIVDISLNTCILLGYHKQEIIGKSMNTIIPEIYHKFHIKLFNDVCEKTKTEFFENLSKKITYSPKFVEFSAFGRNKSKYLVPLDLKTFFVQTEENELVYIVELAKKKLMNRDFYEDNENAKNQFCCILTDNHFIIQTFTSNCIELLGLNSNIINSNQDITYYIKQFNSELQSLKTSSNKDFSGCYESEMKSNDNSYKNVNNSNNINDKSFENLKYKKKLIKLKYTHPRKITWKTNIDKKQENLFQDKQEIGKTQITLFSPAIFQKELKNKKEKNFIMEVKEAYILKNHIGYYFYFKKIKSYNDYYLNNVYKEKDENKSPKNKRPSVKFINSEENVCKSSRIYNKEEINPIYHKSSFNKLGNDSRKKNLNVNFDLDNIVELKKHESDKILKYLDEMDYVDDRFIPKCGFNFILDLKEMSYKPSAQKNSCIELNKMLRAESMEKLKLLHQMKKNKKEESSITSKTENSSYYSSSFISSSKSNSSDNPQSNITNNNQIFTRRNNNRKGSIIEQSLISHKKININETHKGKKIYMNDLEFNYYKVNINSVKFMIYDFNQEMVVNNNNIEKKSQIDIIIENYKSRRNINISEDANYANIPFEKYIKDSKNKNNKYSDKSLSKEKIKKENINIFDKEKEFEKEITYALSKIDEQKSISHFYIISFVFLFIILFMSFLVIYFIIFQYKKLKENVRLITAASNLKYFTNYGIYYIREKTLLSINNKITDGIYKIPDDNPENYKNNITETAKDTFNECNTILESIIGTTIEFSNYTTSTLKQKSFNIEILYNNNKIKNVSTDFYTAMIQVYSSFCNLLVKYSDISSNIAMDDPNLYNFIHNSFNNLGNLLNLQIELFIIELNIRDVNIKLYITIYSCIFFGFHLLLNYLICNSYSSIAKRKSSYIAAFYGIGLPLIKSSIKKCEYFINKINQNKQNIKIRDLDEETSSIMFSSNNNLNSFLTENDFDKKGKNTNTKKRKKTKKVRQILDDKKSIKFRRMYQLGLFASLLYLVIVMLTFLSLTLKFIKNGSYINHMQNYHNNIIELFNSYREYLFDENSIIFGLPVYDYLIQKEETFYSSNTENIYYLNSNSHNIKDLYENYIVLQEKGFCNSYSSYFSSSKQCEDFIGGKDGIISLGFHIMINYFVEKIRNARNYMNLLLDKKIVVGNLSKVIDASSNDSNYNLNNNDSLMFRMKVFNMDQTHFRLNIFFINIILQYIDEERNMTSSLIEKSINNSYKVYMIVLIIYVVIFLLIFFLYWLPMINSLNIEIYKTKNMLSIIPVQILACQPNIKELLDISTKNN